MSSNINVTFFEKSPKNIDIFVYDLNHPIPEQERKLFNDEKFTYYYFDKIRDLEQSDKLIDTVNKDEIDALFVCSSGVSWAIFFDRVICGNIFMFNLGSFPVVHPKVKIQTFAQQPYCYTIKDREIFNIKTKKSIKNFKVSEISLYNDQLLKNFTNHLSIEDRENKIIYFGNSSYLLSDKFFQTFEKLISHNSNLKVSFWLRSNSHLKKLKKNIRISM